MTKPRVKPVPLANLQLDLQNYRHGPQDSQLAALAVIALQQSGKLVSLADDIATLGLDPTDLPIVSPTGRGKDIYTVLEGNRRLAALRILTTPQLLTSIGAPKALAARYRKILDDLPAPLPTEILCAILTEDEAKHWILLKHTGENNGVGVVLWNGMARARYRGSSPATQAVDMVGNSPYVDDETRKNLLKIPITTVTRMLETVEARNALGIDVVKGQLIITTDDDAGLRRLARVIADIANKQVNVTKLDDKHQRIEYARGIAAEPLETVTSVKRSAGQSPKTSSTRRLPADRRTLIPRTLKLAIPHTRINQIYYELSRLPIDDYVNSCAVMFRVFVELSVDYYAARHHIPAKVPTMKFDEMKLRAKLEVAARYMGDNKVLTKHELRGINALYGNVNHVLSVDSLNAYVHNMHYNPTSAELRANWDSIQSFVVALWTP